MSFLNLIMTMGIITSICVGVAALINHLMTVFVWLGFFPLSYKNQLIIENRLYGLFDRRDKLNNPNNETKEHEFRTRRERLKNVETIILDCEERRQDGRFGALKRGWKKNPQWLNNSTITFIFIYWKLINISDFKKNIRKT